MTCKLIPYQASYCELLFLANRVWLIMNTRVYDTYNILFVRATANLTEELICKTPPLYFFILVHDLMGNAHVCLCTYCELFFFDGHTSFLLYHAMSLFK